MKQLYKFKFTSNALDIIKIFNELSMGTEIGIPKHNYARLFLDRSRYGFAFEPLGIPISIRVDYMHIRYLIESNSKHNDYIILEDKLGNTFISFVDSNLKVPFKEIDMMERPDTLSNLFDNHKRRCEKFDSTIPPYSIFTDSDGKLHWSNEMYTCRNLMIDDRKTLVNCGDRDLDENIIYDLKDFVTPSLRNVHSKISYSEYSFVTPDCSDNSPITFLLVVYSMKGLGTLFQTSLPQPL